MHRLALRRCCHALAWQRPLPRARCLPRAWVSASASSPSPPSPPGAPLKAPRRASRRASSPPVQSPTSLLLALQRSERFSRDAELLGALGDLDDDESTDDASSGGPLLALGARLWLEGLQEGRGARQQAVAEALARLAGHGGPRLFGGVCRGGAVSRATVGAALDALEDLGIFHEEEEAGWWSGGSGDDDEEGATPAPLDGGALLLQRRRRPFTRALHQACCAEVDELMRTRVDHEDDDDDDDATER